MNTVTAPKKAAVKLTVITPVEGMLLQSQVLARKSFAFGNDLGAVPVQGVRATLKVNLEEATGKVISSGYRLYFDKHEFHGRIDADQAIKLGLVSPIGKTKDGDVVYQWTASELGFQPNPDPKKPGTWLTA